MMNKRQYSIEIEQCDIILQNIHKLQTAIWQKKENLICFHTESKSS